jgi:hypothetical protein
LLRYNGDIVSRSVRVIDGEAYVPLSDVARIVHGSAVRSGDGYTIQAGGAGPLAGGANQVNGLSGAVGQMLFTGKYRFEVTAITRVPQFTTQYEPTPETITPEGTNDEVVVVSCIVKNGVNQPRQMVFRRGDMGNTALTDDQGQSYVPKDLDFPGGSGYGPTMLPGASTHVNVTFSVPKGTKLTSFICTLTSFEDNNPKDVRVALTP